MDLLNDVTTVGLVLVLALAVAGASAAKSPRKADLLPVDLGDSDQMVADHGLDGSMTAVSEAREERLIRVGVVAGQSPGLFT
jgi:hypothetical protein